DNGAGVFKSCADAFRNFLRDLEAARDDCNKLFAAEAGNDVVGARAGARHTREQPQYFVAGRMAKPVIDRLEMIEVKHQHRDRLASLGLPFAESRGILKKGATIQRTCKMIGRGCSAI